MARQARAGPPDMEFDYFSDDDSDIGPDSPDRARNDVPLRPAADMSVHVRARSRRSRRPRLVISRAWTLTFPDF